MNSTVCILMATYNGSSFLQAQLDSLLNQEHSDWVLYVRDDGSSDHTAGIVDKYSQTDSRIRMIPAGGRNLGSCQNFSALLDYTKGQYLYYMYCDQDDVWLPGKISTALCHMLHKEKIYGKDIPLLVYTDFIYTDESLKLLDKKVDLSPQFPDDPLELFKGLFFQNPVYGCTSLFNSALASNIVGIPKCFKYHDYWTAFVAAAIGIAFHIPKAEILYRQHPQNVTSVYAESRLQARIERLLHWRKLRDELLAKSLQVRIIIERFKDHLTDQKKDLIEEFLQKLPSGGFTLIRFLIKNRIAPRSAINKVLVFIVLFAGVKADGQTYEDSF